MQFNLKNIMPMVKNSATSVSGSALLSQNLVVCRKSYHCTV